MKKIFTNLFIAFFSSAFISLYAQAPTTPTSALVFSGVTTTSITLSWTPGNGARRIVIVDDTGAISTNPANATNYSASSNWSSPGAAIGTGHVAYDNVGNTVTMTNLTPNKVYYFGVFEYNGANLAASTFLIPGTLASQTTLATAPSTDATAMVFSNITNNSITVNYTNGNGSSRLLIGKSGAGAAPTITNGTTYTAAADFSGANIGNGYRVLGIGSGPIVVTGLTVNTSYNFKVIEFNGSGGAEDYKTGGPLSGDRKTEPSTQASALNFTGINITTLQLNWTNGNGDRRVVLIHEAAPVDADPADLTSYNAQANWNTGTQIGTGNYIVYDGTGNNVAVTNLNAATNYYFAVYEYNGTNTLTAAYLTPGATANRQTVAAIPTAEATAMVFSAVTNNSITVNFTNGDGASRVLLGKVGATATIGLANGTTYPAASDFSGPDTGNGYRVLAIGNGPVVVTGLTGNTSYNFRVVEFNGSGGTENYKLGGTPLGGDRKTEPTTQASALNFTAITNTTLTLNWTNGNGDRRLVLIHQGAAVDADPVDFTTYSASANWNNGTPSGTQIGTGNYVVSDGTTNNVAVSNLLANTVYYFAVYEYNGTNTTTATYLTPGATANHTTVAVAPTSDATSMVFSAVTNNSITVNYTNGNGSSRLLIGKQGAGVAATITNGTTYTAAADFSGPDIGGGYRVLGIGNGPIVVTGLTGNTSYNFKVIEFNGTGGAESYKTGSPLAGDRKTEPTTQASGVNFTAIGTTTMTLNWTNGNGDRRLVLMHEGAAVDADPTDMTAYTANANWNSGAPAGTQVGTGNYVMFDGTANTVALTGLLSNTTYYVSVYEYTGTNTSTAAYLTPGATANHVTVASAPSTNSSAIVFSATNQVQTTLTWTNGNGANRVVVGHEAAAVNANPANATAYTADAVFGDLATQIGTGNFVVYNGSGNTVTVTGLNSGTQYFFRVYDYNGSGASIGYSIATPSNNPNSVTTSVGSTTTISPGAGVEPATFSSLINTQGAAVLNFDIDVKDDGATPGSDNTSTRISGITINRKDLASGDVDDWTQAILGASITSTKDASAVVTTTVVLASSITANQIVFTGIPFNGTIAGTDFEMGRVADNTTKTFTLKIWLKTALGGTLPADIDGKNFIFKLTEADITLGSGGSGLLPGQSVESGDAKNVVAVVATKIVVDTQPSANAAALSPLAQQPIFEADDANGNRDLGFTQAITVNTSNPTNLGPVGGPTSFAAGVADYTATGFYFSNVGNSTMKLTTPGITAANSQATNVVTVSGSNESTIDASLFFPSSGIDYTQYQKTGTLNGLPSGAANVGSFVINDGGADLLDADGLSTTLTNISFNITNPGNIRLVGIYDSFTGTIVSTAAPVGSVVTFSGLNLIALDGAQKTFNLFVSFNAPVVDNQHFGFQIATATASTSGSVFAFADAAAGTGGATTATGPSFNTVVVTAQKILFVQQPSNVLIGVAMSPTPTVETVDALGSRDLDYSGTAGLGSTGILAGGASATITSGFGSYTSVIFTDKATARTLTASLFTLPTPTIVSNTFNITASNQADIVLNGAFTEPSNILYSNYQSTNITAFGIDNLPVASFIVRDGGAAVIDTDGANTILTGITFNVTNPSLLRKVALYNGLTELGEVAVVSSTVTFTGLNGGAGFVAPDDGTAIFTIRASFNSTAATITDNAQFQFTVSGTTTTTKSSDFASANAGGASSTVAADQNRIEVVATNLAFTTQPLSNYLVGINLASQGASPVLEARDGFSVTDLDYSSPVTVTNAGALSMTSAPTNITNGFITGATFGALTYTNVGNGQLTVTASTLAANGFIPSSISSNGVTVSVGTATIIGSGTEPGTFSSLNTSAPVTAFSFTVTDDGGAPPNDGVPTLITDLYITADGANNTISNWTQAIQTATLSDGTNTIPVTSIASNFLYFGTIPTTLNALGYITDNAPKVYTLKIQLKTTLGGNLPLTIDGAAFGFRVDQINIFTDANGTSIIGGQFANAGPGKNVVDVSATKINYLTQAPAATPTVSPYSAGFSKTPSPPFPSSGSINTVFSPAIGLEAVDVNGNRDHGFTGSISSFAVNNSLTTLNNPSGAFVNGVLAFPANFQYTTGNNQDGKLTITAGAISNQISPPILIQSSSDSYLYFDQTLPNPALTQSVIQTGALPATITAGNKKNSAVLGRLILSDGGAALSTGPGDTDGAFTQVSSISLSVTNFGDLNLLALYDSITGVKVSSDVPAAAIVTFSGLTIQAPDNSTAAFMVRASFKTTRTDGHVITLAPTAVVSGGGSLIYAPINTIPGKPNKLDVVASALAFAQQPPSQAGTLQPVPLPTGTPVQVTAKDADGNLDLDFDSTNPFPHNTTLTLGASGASLQNTSFTFTQGVATVPISTSLATGLIYNAAGDGTLTASAANLPASSASVTSALSTHVDVYDVTANYSFGNVSTSANIAGGSVDKIIYGVTFSTGYKTAGQPTLQKFVINFGADISVLKNLRVFEQINQANYFQAVAKNIVTTPTIKGFITQNATSITVDFTHSGATARDFSIAGSGPNGTTTYTYFLEVDIDNTANSATPAITPYVEDLGWDFGSPGAFDVTNANIVVTPLAGATQGGAHAKKISTQGQDYSFAAIFPPKLVSSIPANASTNAAVDAPIKITFDVPVWSLDNIVTLYSTTSPGAPGTKVADLQLSGVLGPNGYPGQFAGNYTPVRQNLSSTLTFAVPPGTMVPDQLYYITIAPGVFNGPTAPNNSGVIDQTGNRFGGVSSPGTLYFKTASGNPPLLLTAPAVPATTQISNISLTGATIQATFDRPGTAYFMLVNHNAAAPSRAEILGVGQSAGAITGVAYAPGALTRGSFPITQTNPIAQYGNISLALTNGQQYDVWMFAANNDLPTAIPTVGPYNSSFAAGADNSGTATFTFTAAPTSGGGVYISDPSINICTGSYQPINAPITIVEKNNSDFNGTGTGIQSFNLILPTGFQFDLVNGQVSLSNTTDFVAGSGTISFLSNSVIKVSWTNASTSNSQDNITITGLRVLSSGPSAGDITKLGGSITSIADGAIFANLNSTTSPGISFTNSQNPFTVTFLPDSLPRARNYYAVQLIPDPTTFAPGDFGPSTFSGNGVTLDSLHLNAVSLSAPFNITINHTDNNGCVSQGAIQYFIYDHKTGLGIQSAYCIAPDYFPSINPYTSAYTVRYDAFAGFYLTGLTTVPVHEKVPQFLGSRGSVVNSLPVQGTVANFPANNPHPGTPYYDYNFDVRTLRDQTDWQDTVAYNKTINGSNYYTGGVLGQVNFTGSYQSIANAAQVIPLTQIASFYAPPLLHIEVTGNSGKFDPTGNGNIAATDPVTPGYPGTYIFCEKGGIITFNGYPAASAAAAGNFKIYDYTGGVEGAQITSGGFADNLAGTATLDPTMISNGYKEIEVVYTYKANVSPCQSFTRMIIKVTPNPVALFTASSVIGPNTPTLTAYCAGRQINFDGTSSTINSGFTIANYAWDFGDVNSVNPLPAAMVSHVFDVAATYTASLIATSNYGCASVAATKPITVGNIPVVNFSFSGVTGTEKFVSSATVNPSTIITENWDFDIKHAGTATATGLTNISHAYTPGKYIVQLTSISAVGCANSHSRNVLMVPKVVTSAVNTYLQNFEANDGEWQPYGHKNSTVTSVYSIAPDTATWQWGTPDVGHGKAAAIVQALLDSGFVAPGNKLWVTSLSNDYVANEHSALYTPAFNISALKRPMISFNSFMKLGNDGVVLQYSTDNLNIADSLKVWTTLGDIGTGVDWYNASGILTSPGDQGVNPVGWSGTGSTTTKIWLESKHSLDALNGPTQVVFRFALASSPSSARLDGFALDNFRLGNRTRTVLVENFKNLGNTNPLEKSEATKLELFNTTVIGTELIKLNYDVGFPKNDPLNLDNPADPSARALYYNIASTPLARLDGAKDPATPEEVFSAWGPATYNLRSLQLAQADLFITPNTDTITTHITSTDTTQITANKSISFKVFVKPVANLGANTVLQVAVVEKLISLNDLNANQQAMVATGEDHFNYVVKKMLPTAAGTRFTRSYDSLHAPNAVTFTWTPDPKILYGSATKNLAIVAFLQNQDTKEILQSEIIKNIDNPALVTGLEPSFGEEVTVYPNPADQQLTIGLPGILTKDLPVRIIDQLGRIVYESSIPAGTQQKTITTGELSDALYIIQLGSGSAAVARKKVVVVHGK